MDSQTKAMKTLLQWGLAMVLVLIGAAPALAQAAASRQTGTVKSTGSDSFVLTTAAGQDVNVSVPDGAKVLIVPPGAKDLSTAKPGTVADVQPGDRALVTAQAAKAAGAMTATRVIVMKSAAIAQTHEAEEEAWAKGGGGIVKSVDSANGKITISSGLKTVTVVLQPGTVVRRYSGDSVRFADAKPSTVAEIHPRDQLRVRGTRSADGSSITADEIVSGTFRNYSGLLSSVNQTAGTVTLKDLATKKMVTVAVTANSDVRRLPPMAAQMIAARMHRSPNGPSRTERAGAPARAEHGQDAEDESGARRAGMSLSQMLSKLPTETLADLKTGDAVMIVATSPSAASTQSTAVTLLAGVEPILTAAPSGGGMTLSPWSVGSQPDMGGGEGGPGPGR